MTMYDLFKFIGAGLICVILFVIFWYGAGKLFSAGFHVTKLRMLRQFNLGKENDREQQ